MNEGIKGNEPPRIEGTAVVRRNFIKTTGLASVALGVGLNASRTVARAATSPATKSNA